MYNIAHWVTAYRFDIDSNMELATTLSNGSPQAYLPYASDSKHDETIVVPYGAHNHD